MKVVRIDNIGGINGLQKLIDINKTWELVACGQTITEGLATQYEIKRDKNANFAVFKEKKNQYPDFYAAPFIEDV